MKKVTVLVPCYNEESGIAAVIKGFPREKMARMGFELEVLVVDNNSKDRTAEVARAAGARVIFEPKQGKGNAIRSGFYNISEDTDFVVMLDGDDTYKTNEILRLLEPLESGFSDVIIGSRLGGRIKSNSMRGFNRMGNWLFSFLVRVIYKVNVTDVLTGYFAWKREVVVELRQHLRSPGFAIEMEMITKMARLGHDIYSVPISYDPRLGESSLRPVHDGYRILKMYFKSLHWKPRPQRIAFVSDAVYPYNMGGKEKRLHEISRRLVREGREVHIYTMKWWDGPKVITQDGVFLHAIGKLHPLYKNNKRSIKEALLFGAACLKLIREPMDIVDVDHMPFFPLFSMWFVCKLRRKKLYGTWHEVWGKSYWKNYMGLGGILGSVTERISLHLPYWFVSNSEHTTESLRAAGVKKRIVTIPLGVDTNTILTAPTSPISSDIIYVGRLLSHKNVDLLVRAVALVHKTKRDLSCVIIGEGPERHYLESLADELHVKKNITFFNVIEDHVELYGLMKASKMLVLPSVREGFGVIVVEANACGLPVITTAHAQNAARELIFEGENGLLSDTTEEALAQQILKILNHEGTLEPAKTLSERFAKYQWQYVAEEIEKVFAASI